MQWRHTTDPACMIAQFVWINSQEAVSCGSHTAIAAIEACSQGCGKLQVLELWLFSADGIYTTDAAFDLVRQEGAFLASKNGQQMGSCNEALGQAPAFDTDMDITDCDYTWVDGLPGTG